jgi:hypothetical protein
MTLFFIGKDIVRDRNDPFRALDELDAKRRISFGDLPSLLASISLVIVVVRTDDIWVTVKDCYGAKGKIVRPRRRAELLSEYVTVTRPTSDAKT